MTNEDIEKIAQAHGWKYFGEAMACSYFDTNNQVMAFWVIPDPPALTEEGQEAIAQARLAE